MVVGDFSVTAILNRPIPQRRFNLMIGTQHNLTGTNNYLSVILKFLLRRFSSDRGIGSDGLASLLRTRQVARPDVW